MLWVLVSPLPEQRAPGSERGRRGASHGAGQMVRVPRGLFRDSLTPSEPRDHPAGQPSSPHVRALEAHSVISVP